jgi:FlaG protein
MSFEIGPVPPVPPGGIVRRTQPATPGFSLDLARRVAKPPAAPDTALLSLPAAPPADALDAVGAAAARAAELRAANRELHFRKDEESGRVIVEVRDLEGHVIRTIPPSHALDVMAGAVL